MTGNIFRFQLLFAYVPAAFLAGTFILPWLQSMDRAKAQRLIATFHSFRFVGLVFAVPGVVGASLPAAFAIPAAYGDAATSLLAVVALAAFRVRPVFLAFVALFDVVGVYDLIDNYVHGITMNLPPLAGQLGAAYYILILYVPLLMLTHAISIYLLLRRPSATIAIHAAPADEAPAVVVIGAR